MPLEKILQKIRQQLNELGPLMESFREETIQPVVKDCEELQRQLCILQENLAVYKYHKIANELSPSYKIHAKVSEMEAAKVEPPPVSTPADILQTPVKTEKKAPEQSKPETQARLPLTVAINDKFRFINELFSQNSSEYNIVMEQVNSLGTWHESEIYLNSLKSVYGWKENNEIVKYFYSLVKKRFD